MGIKKPLVLNNGHIEELQSEDAIPVGAVTNGMPTGGITGSVLVKNSATNYDAIWSYPVKNRVYCPSGTNLGYDDEFDNGSLDAAWTKIDYGSNSTDWYEVADVKGLSFQHNNIITDKCSGILKDIAGLPAPFYIETALIFASPPQAYPALGLLLSTTNVDGTGYQADGAIYEALYASTIPQITSVVKIWSNFSAVVSDNSYSRIDAGGFSNEIYLRLAFASNTVYLYTSIDGVVWKLQGSHAWAYTPAYAGLYLQRGISLFQGQFKYFRVRSGIPSNG